MTGQYYYAKPNDGTDPNDATDPNDGTKPKNGTDPNDVFFRLL
jgi:hypothetical protein